MNRNKISNQTTKMEGLMENTSGEFISGNRSSVEQKYSNIAPSVEDGAQCKGKGCRRFYCTDDRFTFKPINCSGLIGVSYLGKGFQANSRVPGFCEVCEPFGKKEIPESRAMSFFRK